MGSFPEQRLVIKPTGLAAVHIIGLSVKVRCLQYYRRELTRLDRALYHMILHYFVTLKISRNFMLNNKLIIIAKENSKIKFTQICLCQSSQIFCRLHLGSSQPVATNLQSITATKKIISIKQTNYTDKRRE